MRDVSREGAESVLDRPPDFDPTPSCIRHGTLSPQCGRQASRKRGQSAGGRAFAGADRKSAYELVRRAPVRLDYERRTRASRARGGPGAVRRR